MYYIRSIRRLTGTPAGPALAVLAMGRRPKGAGRRRGVLLAVGAVVLVAGGGSVLAACTRPSAPARFGPIPGQVNAVASGPGGPAWAVGSSCTSCNSRSGFTRTLILRWDGTGWSRTPSPSPGFASLWGVSAGPGRAAWAVGTFHRRPGLIKALILRWDGAAWSQVPSPAPGAGSLLDGVTAGSGGTGWAVGRSCTACGTSSEIDKTLILRWDGAAWSQTPSPSPSRYSYLAGVSLGPGGTAWAVGSSCTACGTSSEGFKTLILRWDGAAWSQVPSPSPGPDASLSEVSAGPGGIAWAVGFSLTGSLILRWDGRNWSRIRGPGTDTSLFAVSAGTGGTVWAVGSRPGAAPSRTLQTLIVRWNGTAWSQIPSPSHNADAVLSGVSAGPGGTAFAVGHSYTTAGFYSVRAFRTLILRWNGSTWSPG